ncbi:hypothetical protein ACN9JF_15845 [Pseudoalteromonas lipolytica]|uniref:hypothetical protein n=1 Tax=Pseudoalteromonas lipolytica TaxID=570156 RepID=UPI003B9F4008
MSYLINSSKPISSVHQLKSEGGQYIELAEAGYQIPIVWLMFFNEDDFIESKIEYMDGEGNLHYDTISLPCTTVKKAKENIENSHRFFTELFQEPEIAIGYLDKTIALFDELEYEYLILDASEYFYMNIDDAEWHLFRNAFLRNEKAKRFIFEYSGYDEAYLPYPVEEFYSNPHLDDYDRINNSTALNPAFSDPSYRIRYPHETASSALSKTDTASNKKWWQFWKSE